MATITTVDLWTAGRVLLLSEDRCDNFPGSPPAEFPSSPVWIQRSSPCLQGAFSDLLKLCMFLLFCYLAVSGTLQSCLHHYRWQKSLRAGDPCHYAVSVNEFRFQIINYCSFNLLPDVTPTFIFTFAPLSSSRYLETKWHAGQIINEITRWNLWTLNTAGFLCHTVQNKTT